MRYVTCSHHGRQGIGLVCTHIAQAADRGEQVWFFWGDVTDTARPDAWCLKCEQALRRLPAGAFSDAWFAACDFKVLCSACWDHAKRVLYDGRRN
jgi:hypothetical protein